MAVSVSDVESEMKDCLIPHTIRLRSTEFMQFNQKLELLKGEFQIIEQADKQPEGNQETE